MNPKKITIIDVAKEAGLSIASVSRFLNNPNSLRKENTEKIARAIKKLNYRPLIHAQRLAGGKLNTFGLIIPGYEGIFYSFYAWEIIRGISLALEQNRLDLHLNIYWNKDTFKSSLVDGVILADVLNNRQQLLRFVKEGLPCVVINKKIDDIDVSYVAVDNFKGGYDATDFLIKHGHKKIAHIAGDLNAQCARERVEGYNQALKTNNVPVDEKYVKVANFSRAQARTVLEGLLSLPEIPTAVFCASDDMALEVLNFAKEKNIAVPGKLSVVGFDDNPHCLYGDFALTTVRQPLTKMAQIAVSILRDLVDEKSAERKKIVLTPELVVRDTVGFL